MINQDELSVFPPASSRWRQYQTGRNIPKSFSDCRDDLMDALTAADIIGSKPRVIPEGKG
ncbi:MAG: hypothetical protein KA403_08010 [Candidatus Omnitrophica bacterium]|nr:hypothetical protein [Candidatus Omnitrophota bacterium]